ncbi:hypothetical protein Aperf_G00000008197 [Anoplocephala perfoliata]
MYSVGHSICRSNRAKCVLRYLKTLSVIQLWQPKRHQCSQTKNNERTASWAAELIRNCSESERKHLYDALKNASTGSSHLKDSPLPTNSQHRLVFLASATPFIGFGFLDNCIMIVAGEYVDMTLAEVFGFSTMAAAGIGNLISDLCGLGLAGYVERYATLFGVNVPTLTETQLKSNPIRRTLNLGRMCGITLGCLIGMLPLLLFATEEKEIMGTKKAGESAAAAVKEARN